VFYLTNTWFTSQGYRCVQPHADLKRSCNQGKQIQIVLPSKDDYEDTPYLLAKAVKLLSVLASVSFQEIVAAITFGASGAINASVPVM
jgi:hypothetical protein